MESRKPLRIRTTSSDEDEESSVIIMQGKESPPAPPPLADTSLSRSHTLPKSIDWSLTYSSDEESQQQHQQRLQRARSFSEPGIDLVAMRRRPRTSTSFLDYRHDRQHHHHRPADPARVHKSCLVTPMMCLAIMFAITCYTTFWLPYPDVRPDVIAVHRRGYYYYNNNYEYNNNNLDRHHAAASPAASSRPTASATLRQSKPASMMMMTTTDNTQQGWHYARTERAREPLIYRKEEDPVLKYYQQEGFRSRSRAKEANIAMLLAICVWAVWEQQRQRKRRYHQLGANNNGNDDNTA